jgi:cytochrome c-type biogenesis protein CcmE
MSQEKSSIPRVRGIRWGWIVIGLIILVIVASFFLNNQEGAIQYYMTASEYVNQQSKYDGKKLKVAGKVKKGSIRQNGGTHEFIVEDLSKEIIVTYVGLVPDTFKEGSEVVVEGRGQSDNHFVAVSLMAKCASKYQAGGLPPIEQMRGKSQL